MSGRKDDWDRFCSVYTSLHVQGLDLIARLHGVCSLSGFMLLLGF